MRTTLLALVASLAISPASAFAAGATLTLHADKTGPVINKNIYGHFAEHLGRCIYEGVWVGPDSPIPNTNGYRNDVLAALKELQVPVLRWPGGCFADEYHWKDGIGPREKRPAMINTLQAMILTDKERMLLTPTYHVFEMFNVHQAATSLAIELTAPDYKFGDASLPGVSASASRDAAGKVNLSLVNTNPNEPVTITCTLAGMNATKVAGRILTAPAMNTHNTFDAPETIKPAPFTGAKLEGNKLTVALPAKSVVVLEL